MNPVVLTTRTLYPGLGRAADSDLERRVVLEPEKTSRYGELVLRVGGL